MYQLDQVVENNSEQWTGTIIIVAQSSARPGRRVGKNEKKNLSFVLMSIICSKKFVLVSIILLSNIPSIMQFVFWNNNKFVLSLVLFGLSNRKINSYQMLYNQ